MYAQYILPEYQIKPTIWFNIYFLKIKIKLFIYKIKMLYQIKI